MAVFLASEVLGGNVADPNPGNQTVLQLLAPGVAAVTAIATWVLLKTTDVAMGLRATEQGEADGLDVVSHEESGYRH